MKFSDFPYKRPYLDVMCGAYTVLIKKMSNAVELDEAVKLIEEHERLLRGYFTCEALAMIRHTIDTEDDFYAQETMFLTQEYPRLMEQVSLFMAEILRSPLRSKIEKRYPKIWITNTEMSLNIINSDVIDLLARESGLELKYQRIISEAKLTFHGELISLNHLGIYKNTLDPQERRSVYQAESKSYLEHSAELDRVFDELIEVRTEISRRLGFDSFVELAFLRRTRSKYNASMVAKFRSHVKKHLVPLVCELKKRQAVNIGLERLEIQDNQIIYAEGSPELLEKDPAVTYKKLVDMLSQMSPETRELITDLDTRELYSYELAEKKYSGYYSTYIPDYDACFVFANFDNTANDVEAFVHEFGHAFATSVALKRCPLIELMNPKTEIREVHSMALAFLLWPWLEMFFGAEAEKSRVVTLVSTLDSIIYGCMIDEFENIIYTEPELTPQQRNDRWLEIERTYRPYIDITSIPHSASGRGWQQLHVCLYPFSNIEYSLAQSVALELFVTMQNDGWDSAWQRYFSYVCGGGTKDFVELLLDADISSPFDESTIKEIAKTAESYLEGKY